MCFCPQQTDVSMLEPEKSRRKSKKRTKGSTETTEVRGLNKKGAAPSAPHAVTHSFLFHYKPVL